MDAVPYIVLIGLLAAAVLAVLASRRGHEAPPAEQPRVDPSAVRPDIYIAGEVMPDRRRENRPTRRSGGGLRQETVLDDGGAVAFVPPPPAAAQTPAAPPGRSSSPEELGIDLSRPLPPRRRSPTEIDTLPPERGPGD